MCAREKPIRSVLTGVRDRVLPLAFLALWSCGTTSATRDEVSQAVARAEMLRGESGCLITICMDGTWNVPVDGTNVWQFHELAKTASRDHDVIAYYTEGVGTTLATSKKGGKLGYGMDSRVSDAYAFLCNTWKPGDQLVLVGFSRGAYQARLLAGVIDEFGIYSDHDAAGPRRPQDQPDAKTCCKAFFAKGERTPGIPIPKHKITKGDGTPLFPMRGKWYPAEIDCLVCFDTVAAVAPLQEIVKASMQRYRSPPSAFTPLFDSTRLALHAMALDETREAFAVVPFSTPAPPERLKQVWFAGAHSDVGGGYEPHGQNQVALAWVLENLPEPVRKAMELPRSMLPPLHDEDQGVWRTRRRATVDGSVLHPSVQERVTVDPSYRPHVDWWSPSEER